MLVKQCRRSIKNAKCELKGQKCSPFRLNTRFCCKQTLFFKRCDVGLLLKKIPRDSRCCRKILNGNFCVFLSHFYTNLLYPCQCKSSFFHARWKSMKFYNFVSQRKSQRPKLLKVTVSGKYFLKTKHVPLPVVIH